MVWNGILKNKPAKVEEFKQMFENYQKKLDLLKLKDEFLNPNTKSITLFDRFKMLIFMILGFPIYIYGLINNYIPYTVPRWLALKLKRAKSEIASTKLLAGIVMFLTYYGLEIFVFNYFIENTPIHFSTRFHWCLQAILYCIIYFMFEGTVNTLGSLPSSTKKGISCTKLLRRDKH